MYARTTAYKEEMLKELRDNSYVYVYLGLINQEAQDNAEITSELADFSQIDIFGNPKFEAYYSTAEENFSNDSSYFMPEPNLYNALNQGAVSKDLKGAITFVFSTSQEKIGGLTIDFGEIYPTEFEATNGRETYTYHPSKGGQFIARGNFTDSDYITITPISMIGGEQRLRIHSVLFGIGFQFGNKDLISTKRANTIHHLSEELPQKSFEFTIDNLNQDWTIDNPNSYSGSLKEMQIVQVTYGRELEDGSIYKIPSGYMALQSWSSNHTTASFKAVGFLDYSTTTYYQGKVEEITLYDLAEKVFEDMGITSYKIDVYLKRLSTKNPLPIDYHKNCLQMIANAGLCAMYEDGNGVITLKASIASPDYTVTVENYEPFSNLASLTGSVSTYNFASAELDYSNDDTFFIQSIETQQQTGVVSMMGEELRITLVFEATWTFTGLTLSFGVKYPSAVTIEEYYSDTISAVNTFEPNSVEYYIDHEFYEVDKIVIKFAVDEGKRVHINRLLIGAMTDYTIREKDMRELPNATQTDRIRSVNIKYFDFIATEKQMTATVNADKGENLVTFDNPCLNYELSTEENVTLEITDSGAYYIIFTASDEAKVLITANQYEKAENTVSVELRETGQDLTLENDLISSRELAEKVAAWYAEYYGAEIEYSLNYRGEPALDCGDRIFLENRFIDNNMILVTSEELSTSTGMNLSNKITARRLTKIDYELD